MSGPALDRLDHLVLTVRDAEATCAFSERVHAPGRDTVAHFIEGLDRVEAEQWRRVWPHFSLMP